jgi:ribosomal protein RSM22 (predicted rRNA methylase)
VVDQVAEALGLGRRLSARAGAAALRSATWRQAGVSADLPAADLVTISYLLGELSAADQAETVRRAAAAASVLVIVEPGTPDGYGRVLAARTALLEQGLTIAAPCPHQLPCPIVAGRDWCHFAARVNRSSLHRQLKNAELSYEDEKFSYVVAVRVPVVAPQGRVLRHPQLRKGLVSLRLCGQDAALAAALVSKRQGDVYRAARDVEWGDGWPPAL